MLYYRKFWRYVQFHRDNLFLEKCYINVMKKNYMILWILFAVFLLIRIFFKMSYWIVLSIETCGLAIAILIQAKLPSKKHIIISIILSVLSTVAYLGYQRNPWILLCGLRAGIPTLLCSLAVFSVMEKRKGFVLLSRKGKHPLLITLLISLAAGLVLSAINLIGEKINFDFSWWKLLLCLNPAIYEEIAYRAIFIAFCIWSANGKMTIFQYFTMYVMATLPHSMVHGYPFWPTVMLTFVFGLPFAILQKKRDLTSSMISHGIVDAFRFVLMGF